LCGVAADDTGQRGAHLRAVHLLREQQRGENLVEDSDMASRGGRSLTDEELVPPKCVGVANYLRDMEAGRKASKQRS
jgi:hypothetical protein